MKTVSFRLGKLLSRLRREGIPSRAALCEAVREARRAFEAGRVPEWLILEILADAESSEVLDHPDPTGEFWLRLRRSMEKTFRDVETRPLPNDAGYLGTQVYWLAGDRPGNLLGHLMRECGSSVHGRPLAEADESPADERLLVLPADMAMDAIPTVLGAAARIPLTGFALTGLDWPLRDAALLVLGPATGIPVQWISFYEDGRDIRMATPTSAVRLLVGEHLGIELQAVLAPFEKGCVSPPTTLPEMLELFSRLIERSQLRFALEMMPAHLRSFETWDLDRLEKQIRGTLRILESMTETERKAPERIDEARLKWIAAAAGAPPEQVRRLIRDYLARRDLAAPPRDGT